MKSILVAAIAILLAPIAIGQEIDGTSIKFTIPDGVALKGPDAEGEVYLLTWNGNGDKTFLMFSHAPEDAQKRPHEETVSEWHTRFTTQFEKSLPEGFKVTSVEKIERNYAAWKGHEILMKITTSTNEELVHAFFILRDKKDVWFAQFRGDAATYKTASSVLRGAKPKSEQDGAEQAPTRPESK